VTYPNPHSAPPPQPGPGGPGAAWGQPAPPPAGAAWPAPAGIDLGALPAGAAPQRRGRGRLIAVIAGALAVLLLGAGGAFAVALWKGFGRQPESAVPASTAAFARLDLSPGLGQLTRLAALAGKFPDAKSVTSPDELRYQLVNELVPGMSRQEVEGWFGDRLGVGLWQHASAPVAVIALASDDDEKAGAALARARAAADDGELGFVVSDGYALVVRADRDAQAAADAAARAAEEESLADQAAFADALDKLPDGQLALGWVDAERVRPMLEKAAEAGGARAREAFSQALPQLRGQVVVGAQATDAGFEVRARAIGQAGLTGATDVRPQLEGLPAATGVGLALSGGDHLRQAVEQAFPLLPPEVASPQLKDALKKITTVSLALDRLGGAVPGVALLIRTADDAAAEVLTEAAKPLAGSGSVQVTRKANGVQVATAGYVGGGGRLGDSARYREAMTGMPDTLYLAGYADVEKLLADAEAPADMRRSLGPVKAVSLGVGPDGDGHTVLLRVLIP